MYKIAVLFVLLVMAQCTVRAQETRIIKFRQQPLATRLSHYRVAEVKDDRADTGSIGSVRAGLFSKKSVSLNLPGGPARAITEFFGANLKQDLQSPPVSLHIAQLEVGEKTGGLKAESEVRMTIFFYAGGKKIMEYKGANSVQASLDATRYIEELIRKSLDNILQQFDSWCDSNKEQLTASLAGPSVTVEVELKGDAADSDKIAWSFHRPLTLADFRARPDDLSRAAAVTYSGIDVKYSVQSQYGQTKVLVTMTPFFDKTHSWCRSGASYTLKTLMHEQQHFDITAIKACELANAMRSHAFTPENYVKELEQLYKIKEKELRDQQELYDSETHHGQLPVIQQKWESQIHDSLQGQSCYHQ